MSLSRYSYKPLNGLTELRLFEILPGNDNTPINGSLINFALDSHPHYEALSYSWGDPKIQSEIHCEGQPIRVTTNCDNALRHLRYPDRSRFLWVDAICIDQNNLDERSQQVSVMQTIYQQAECVLIWLGIEADDSDVAFELLERLKGIRLKHEREILFLMMQETFGLNQRPYSNDKSNSKHIDIDQSIKAAERQLAKQTSEKITADGLILDQRSEREGLPGLLDPKWEALTKLLCRSWFSRVWVYQEVVLARKATIFCGMMSMPWSEFSISMEGLFETILPVPPVEGCSYPMSMIQSHGDWRSHGRLDFLEILHRLSGFSCTDGRDRVYGVLGMVRRENDDWLKVDYTLTLEEVFTSATLSILHSHLGLDVLLFAQEPKLITSLPSWTPDWTAKLPSKYLSSPSWYRASGTNSTPRLNYHISDNNAILTIPQSRVGKIRVLGACMPLSTEYVGEELEYLHRVAEVFREWQTFALNSPGFTIPVYENQSKEEAFWRTVVVDSDIATSMQNRAPETLHYNYEHFYSKLRMAQRGFFDDCVVGLSAEELEKTRLGLGMIMGLQDPDFKIFYQSSMFGRAYCFVTVDPMGWFGLVPRSTCVGDEVIVIQGLNVPFVVRQVDDEERTKKIIGPCFVHGLMDGNLVERSREVKFSHARFV